MDTVAIIYGNRTVSYSDPKCLLFGNEEEDDVISKIRSMKKLETVPEANNESVLLAVCSYDISSVVQNIWDFKEKGQCHVPGLILYQKCMGFYNIINYSDMKNVNEININPNIVEFKSTILENTLLDFGTSLKVEVYLLAPQTASLILMRIPNTFKRFLFILNSYELSKNVLTSIIKHNDGILSENTDASESDLEFTDVITGFLIDNGNSSTFFLEGLSTGFILTIENITIKNFDVERGKFFFNTDTVFEKRLYNSFMKEGLHALKRLCLLFHSSSYKSILQYNLLPKPEELLSLNLEWGVPLMANRPNEKMRF
ncbi:hypothetical protein NQ315_017544 [Exocentrus adspersus]|uniref:MutS-like protein n=1 Tax=Exocentrus adspersus TaxID=1586481 RepID=A0AAV8V619_9CUCU|nr:hypothetical protein NQ315_017544 [Exocentrus adspersus]